MNVLKNRFHVVLGCCSVESFVYDIDDFLVDFVNNFCLSLRFESKCLDSVVEILGVLTTAIIVLDGELLFELVHS